MNPYTEMARLTEKGHLKFIESLKDPHRTQESILFDIINRNKNTSFGKKHGFSRIRTYQDFAAIEPQSYADYESSIAKIRTGANPLTQEPIEMLQPTSGTQGLKLIPFTKTFATEFQHALDPWLHELFTHTRPGKHYWSISPHNPLDIPSQIKIGFADIGYLSGDQQRTLSQILAVPPIPNNLEQFKKSTLEFLKKEDISVISVWSPTFLLEICDKNYWDLSLISCWTDGSSEKYSKDLEERFKVKIQSKGLIATEGIVSIPFQGTHPLAINSHFLEFQKEEYSTDKSDQTISKSGPIIPASHATPGTYSVLLTTSAGLYRYKLEDLVEVTGSIYNTPTIKFVSRNKTSDHVGEKLDERFVLEILNKIPGYTCIGFENQGYILFAENASNVPKNIEESFNKNYHYAYARKMGQLKPLRTIEIPKIQDKYCNITKTAYGDCKIPIFLRGNWTEKFQSKDLE